MPAKSMLSYKSEFAYLAFWRTALQGTGYEHRSYHLRRRRDAGGPRRGADGGKAIQKTTISLGAATPGGGFPLYGNAFAEVLNEAESDALDRAAQHQGQHREYPAAGSRPARHRAVHRRTGL